MNIGIGPLRRGLIPCGAILSLKNRMDSLYSIGFHQITS